MSDPTPSTEKTTIVVPNLCRLWTLAIISLGLNGLILIGFLLCAVCHHHHHHKHHGFGGHGGGCGQFCNRGSWGGGGRGFHRFGGPQFGRGGNWGGPRGGFGPGQQGGPGFGPGSDMDKGPKDGGPGAWHGGMMGHPGTSPDPAKVSDMVLAHLTTTLSLTDDQKAKLKPIIDEQVADFQKQMEANRAAMAKQIDDAKEKIKPLLNPDQQKQLDAMKLPGQKPPQ